MAQNRKKQLETMGECAACMGIFSKKEMASHLDSCRSPKVPQVLTGDSKETNFYLLVEGHDAPEYWLYLSAPMHLKLKQLDGYLRRTWLECCGHLSSFEIDGERYESMVEEADEKDMSASLGSALRIGAVFQHDYDFGSTTELILTVLGTRHPEPGRRGVQLLARNESPVIPCGVCGKRAFSVCANCVHEEEGWLCYECKKAHKCGPEPFLPIVNSPRTGVCGYIGYY